MRELLRGLHLEMHQRLREVPRHAAGIPPDRFAAQLEGFARPTVGSQINHVLYCEEAWVRALRHLPKREWPHDQTSVEELFALTARAGKGTVEYLDLVSEVALGELLPAYPDYWVGPPRTPAFILMHVVTHAFHHKGQMVAMLRALGYPMADTDLQRGVTPPTVQR